jgi:hypothetical protein
MRITQMGLPFVYTDKGTMYPLSQIQGEPKIGAELALMPKGKIMVVPDVADSIRGNGKMDEKDTQYIYYSELGPSPEGPWPESSEDAQGDKK